MMHRLAWHFATTLPVKVTMTQDAYHPSEYGPIMLIEAVGENQDDMAFVLDRLGDELKRMAKTLRDHS